jgi:hypothetical protein
MTFLRNELQEIVLKKLRRDQLEKYKAFHEKLKELKVIISEIENLKRQRRECRQLIRALESRWYMVGKAFIQAGLLIGGFVLFVKIKNRN